MKKFLRSLLVLLIPVLSLAQTNPIFVIHGQKNRLLNGTKYDPFIQAPLGRFDIFANNRSFGVQGGKMIDGNISEAHVKGHHTQPYWPNEEIVDLRALYALDRIEVWDVGGGASLTISSGLNQFDSLTVDYNITLNQNQKRTFDFSGKQARFISIKLNQSKASVQPPNTALKNGPAEIRIFGKALSVNPVPLKVERPRQSFGHLFGANMDVFSPMELHAWPGTHFRAYDRLSKHQNAVALPNTKYAFKNSYEQGFNYDAYLQTQKNAGITTLMVYPGTSIPEALYKPSYIAGGSSDYNAQGQFNRAVQYGADPKVPANYALNSHFAYQYALHYGCTATDTNLAKIDHARDGYPTKVGTCWAPLVEIGNEEDNWFRNEKEGYHPDEFAAKSSAIYDGHCGTMGAGYGCKQADANFKVVMPASADFGLDYIKRVYYWCQKNRPDKKFPFDAINVHSYLNTGGGQFVDGAIGIAPERYKRDGYAATGVKEYLDEFSDWVKRYLPGVEIWWTEFGYDSNPYSPVGVPMLTQAQAAAAPAPLNSTFRVQAALLLRTYFEAMATTSVDRMTMFTLQNYRDCNESAQRFDDLDESPVTNWTSTQLFQPAEQFATSGLTVAEYGWVKGLTSPIDVTAITVGSNVTLALDSLRPYYIFSGTIELRDPADNAGNGAALYGSVVSQNQTQLIIKVGNLGPGGIKHRATGTFSSWRIRTAYAKKTSWFAVDNAYAVLDTSKRLVRDESTSELRHYVFAATGGTQEVHCLYLPTETGNKLTRVFNIGTNNAQRKNLESVTGKTTNLSPSSNSITVDVTEMPKLILCNTNGNAFPVVNAGSDISSTATTATLTATATDNGSISAYSWKKLFGGSVTMTGTTTSTLSLSGMAIGTYVFNVTVTDNQGAKSVDDVQVVVTEVGGNNAPTASAGSDQTIASTSTTISGFGTDGDGSIASYLWTKQSGGSATLSGSTTSTLSLTGLTTGSYVFRLTVTDNLGATGFDEVSVTVTVSNSPPVAAFLGTINATSSSITLYDNGSYDPDGTIASYAWTRLSGPNTPTLVTPNSMNTVVNGLINGTYVFREIVTDNLGAKDTSDVTTNITGVGGGNTSPTALAGSDQSISITTATVTGSGTDTDGTIASYLWTKQSGASVTMTGTTTTSLGISGLANGTYVFRLTVTDDDGATGIDDMTITVTGIGGGGGATTSVWEQTVIHTTLGSGHDIQTLVRKPIGYGNGTDFPVIVYCVGQGEKYNGTQDLAWNIANCKSAGLPKALNEGLEIPAIVVIPIVGFANFETDDNVTFQKGLVTSQVRQYALDNYDADPQRCHLTGISFGGQTIFLSAIAYPTLWASCVPMLCNPQHSSLCGPIRCPMWFYSTQNDTQSSPATVHDAIHYGLNGLGNIPFTSYYSVFAGLGHEGWNNMYKGTLSGMSLMTGGSVPDNHAATPIWWQWMLQYKIVSGVVSLY
jgi:hypothetical protein